MTAWNPKRVATFDVVRYAENGVERALSYDEFRNLAIDARVKLLLLGKPRFFLGNVPISRARALSRQG